MVTRKLLITTHNTNKLSHVGKRVDKRIEAKSIEIATTV